jgi:predicted RNase H-like HicB family nuclease
MHAADGERAMKQRFTASRWQEDDWVIAQCLEVDVASQGETEEQALANLAEALALHLEEPETSRGENGDGGNG